MEGGRHASSGAEGALGIPRGEMPQGRKWGASWEAEASQGKAAGGVCLHQGWEQEAQPSTEALAGRGAQNGPCLGALKRTSKVLWTPQLL